MSVIHIPRRHFVQPQGRLAASPQWADRLLSLVYLGEGGPRDVVDSAANYALSGATSRGVFDVGVGLGLNKDSGLGFAVSSNAMAGYSGEATTVQFLPEIGPNPDSYGMMLYAIPSARYSQFAGSGGAQMYAFGAGTFATPGGAVYGSRNRTVAVRHAGEKALFVDRQKQAYSSTTTAIPSGTKSVRIGAWTGAGWTFSGIIGSTAVFAGALTDDEIFELVAEPWSLYQADPLRIYSVPSGPISPTITGITASNITQTGATITLGLTR